MADFSFLPQLDTLPVMNFIDRLKKEPKTLNLEFIEGLSNSLSVKSGQDPLRKELFPPPFFTLSSVPTPMKFSQVDPSASLEGSLPSHRRRSKKSIFYYCSMDPSDNRPPHLMECPGHFFATHRPKISNELYGILTNVPVDFP